MTPLTGLEWLRVTSVPRLADVEDPRRWMSAGVRASVVSAHSELLTEGGEAQGPALAAAWVRPPGSDRTHFLLGGRPSFPLVHEVAHRPVSGVDQSVLFPPGARGEPVEQDDVEGWLEPMTSWVRCLGTGDVRSDDEPADSRTGPLPSGLEDYAVHVRRPFVWLVVAEPLAPASLETEIGRLVVKVMGLRKLVSVETSRVDLVRCERQMRELTRGRASGLWRVNVLAGGTTAAEARLAASLLCSSADTSGSGHVLFPKNSVGGLAEVWEDQEPGPDAAASPFLAGSDLVADLMRPPVRELPGIRLRTAHRFDVTPVFDPSGEGATLGSVLDEGLSPVGRFDVPYSTLNRHGFICGATGSGKSQTARRLLESMATGARRIPWLVVEPAKAEYASMNGRLGEESVLVIRPGDLAAPPAALNPLEPAPGFPLQGHADLVRALFMAAFEANEPFPQVLSHALINCYTAAGWDLVTGRRRDPVKPKLRVDEPDRPTRPRYPTLRELQATARKVVDDIGYGHEVAADVRGFVDVRIGSLRQGAPGRFFEGGHPLDIEQLLNRHVVLELEPITNDQDKAFLMGTILIRLVEHLRVRQQTRPAQGLSHVLLIEEAHRLLKNVQEGPAAAAVGLFASLLAEIRAYGEGVVVVEQIPSKVLPDVLKNTAFKVMHRLPAQDDRDAVGATMNLDAGNSEAVVSFLPGIAAVAVDGDDRPLLVQVEGGMDREVTGRVARYPPLDGRRSILCGGDCHTRACSLDEIAAAQNVADEPSVVVWAEAVAAALILGSDAPRPRETVLRAWLTEERSVSCSLATLADRATEARRPRLQRWVDPDDFSRHLVGVLEARLRGRPVSDEDPRRWQAGAYRWKQVYAALRAAVRDVGGPEAALTYQPHPLTQEWRLFGLDLDALSLGGQFAQLKNDPAYGYGSERVLTGDIETSGLRKALLTLTGGEGSGAIDRALIYATHLTEEDGLLQTLKEHFAATEV